PDSPVGERLFETSGKLQNGIDVRAVQVSSTVLNDRKGPNVSRCRHPRVLAVVRDGHIAVWRMLDRCALIGGLCVEVERGQLEIVVGAVGPFAGDAGDSSHSLRPAESLQILLQNLI